MNDSVNETRIIEKCHCNRCNYDWWPNKEKHLITNCPRCRSRRWNKTEVDNRGYRDGRTETIWTERIKQKE